MSWVSMCRQPGKVWVCLKVSVPEALKPSIAVVGQVVSPGLELDDAPGGDRLDLRHGVRLALARPDHVQERLGRLADARMWTGSPGWTTAGDALVFTLKSQIVSGAGLFEWGVKTPAPGASRTSAPAGLAPSASMAMRAAAAAQTRRIPSLQ